MSICITLFFSCQISCVPKGAKGPTQRDSSPPVNLILTLTSYILHESYSTAGSFQNVLFSNIFFAEAVPMQENFSLLFLHWLFYLPHLSVFCSSFRVISDIMPHGKSSLSPKVVFIATPLLPQYCHHHGPVPCPPAHITHQWWHTFLSEPGFTLEFFWSHSRKPLLINQSCNRDETCLPVPMWGILHSWHFLCCIRIVRELVLHKPAVTIRGIAVVFNL